MAPTQDPQLIPQLVLEEMQKNGVRTRKRVLVDLRIELGAAR